MGDNKYFGLITPFVVFAGITVWFLVKLKKLNQYLLENYSDESSFTLIAHNNYEPVKFFCGAFILVILGGFLGYYFFRNILRFDLELWEMVTAISGIVLTAILMILIINNIAIPIFQAILSVLFLGGVIAVAFSGSN